jgi:metal-responsive CopG/Arc/MetJ family transcriptional regulator
MNSPRISVRLPRPLYEQLESRALSRRSSLSQVVVAALSVYLEQVEGTNPVSPRRSQLVGEG